MCGSVGGLALEDGMSEPLLSISEITAAGMLESATSRAHWPYRGDSCQPQAVCVGAGSGKDGAVSAGTVPQCQDWGVLDPGR
jgi:hypothetical protein